jgi:hypothetical protein
MWGFVSRRHAGATPPHLPPLPCLAVYYAPPLRCVTPTAPAPAPAPAPASRLRSYVIRSAVPCRCATLYAVAIRSAVLFYVIRCAAAVLRLCHSISRADSPCIALHCNELIP